MYGSYLQDEFSNSELAALGGPPRHDAWVNLYINGIYWGLYNPTEYPDSNWSANYMGGNTADWDTIKVSETGPPVADDGDPSAWNTLYNIAATGSLGSPTVYPGAAVPNALASPAAFQLIEQYLNIPEFIDYMFVEYYAANNDWDVHNWIAVRESRFNGVATNAFGGFEFVNWDGERTLEGLNDNVMGVSSLNGGMQGTPATEDFGPGFLFQAARGQPRVPGDVGQRDPQGPLQRRPAEPQRRGFDLRDRLAGDRSGHRGPVSPLGRLPPRHQL